MPINLTKDFPVDPGSVMESSRVTLKDIAREANVSPASVSLVLRDKETVRVSEATRKRVIEIAERLNYRPNLLARTLVGKGSSTLGLVITTLLNPFYAEITQAIIDRAREKGYSVIATSVDYGGPDVEQFYLDELLDRGVDGLIISSALRNDTAIKNLRKRGVPFVLVVREVDEAPSEKPVDFVGVDDQRGAALATEHLFDLGHTHIAIIAGPQDTSTGYHRLQGVKVAFKARGLEVDSDLIYYGNYKRESGYEQTQKILGSRKKATAIFAANDIMAIGAIEALAEKGLKVPYDMALIGFDDIEIAGLPGVDLTSISHQKAHMGQLAVERLIEKISGKSENVVTKSLIDPILVVRKTCGADAGATRKDTQHC